MTGEAMKREPHGKPGLRHHQGECVSPHTIKDAVVKLKKAAVAHHHIKAHGQERRHKDHGQDVHIEPGKDGREKEKDDEKGCQGPNHSEVVTVFHRKSTPLTRLT